MSEGARVVVQDDGSYVQVSRSALTLKLIRARLETAAVQESKELVGGKEVFLVALPIEELNFLMHMLREV